MTHQQRRELEKTVSDFSDEQMDNSISHVSLISDVRVFGGQMSREEWIDFGKELVEFIYLKFGYAYEVGSASCKHVELTFVSEHADLYESHKGN